MQAKLLNHFLPVMAVNSLGLVRRGLARGRGHVVHLDFDLAKEALVP